MSKSTQELLVDVATYLNSLDKIEPNNKDIWKNYLHRWTNTEWASIFSFLLNLSNDNPKLLKPFQKDQLVKARTAFLNSNSTSDRIMDLKVNKKYAWSVIMLVREVFNTFHEEDKVVKKPNKPKVTTEYFNDRTVVTVFHTLFEE